jgi:hypothetical protein
MENKKPWQSKTMLLNGIAGLIAFLALFWSGASNVSTYISAHAPEIGVGWSLMNVILRAFTKDKVSLSD